MPDCRADCVAIDWSVVRVTAGLCECSFLQFYLSYSCGVAVTLEPVLWTIDVLVELQMTGPLCVPQPISVNAHSLWESLLLWQLTGLQLLGPC